MPTTCAVIKCNSRSGRDNKSFFRIPSVLKHQGEETQSKSEKRQRLWLAAIKRTDISLKTCGQLRVCSDHFISGKPSELYRETNPDWVPTQNLGYQCKDAYGSDVSRYDRLQKRTDRKHMQDAAMCLLDLSASLDNSMACTDLDVDVEPDNIIEEELTHLQQLELANHEVKKLQTNITRTEEENARLKKIIHKMRANTPEDFENDDDKVKYYTGLPTYLTLISLFNLLSPEIADGKNASLNKFQKFILTLMRLRLCLSITDLSYRFGVSKTTVSKVFIEMVDMMFFHLQPLVRWPDRGELYETMPMVFRKYFGRKITAIIDCFEIFIDRPSMTARVQTFSSYKHNNTVKYLIAISPQGSVTFISEGWGGRVSDKYLTANSNFLNYLHNGDGLLADRGFEIKELVATVGAEVIYPAFMRGKKQLSASEVESTRNPLNGLLVVYVKNTLFSGVQFQLIF
ncbi:hypothetical protein SNE40_017158 [Patella caerulea]|uniref:THAP-type domain-containing protein n=1 Tax=Patella caerulea TaxID=87958 RepID=A0AAN8PKZ8_PATCE